MKFMIYSNIFIGSKYSLNKINLISKIHYKKMKIKFNFLIIKFF